MQAYQTLTILPCGQMSDAYIITARSITEAYRKADALALIHGAKVTIIGIAS